MTRPTPAAGEAVPKAKTSDQTELDSFRGLEDQISSLSSMASILSEMLDDCFTGGSRSAENTRTIIVTDYEFDMISFAWNDVASRSGALKKAFYGAIYEGAAR